MIFRPAAGFALAGLALAGACTTSLPQPPGPPAPTPGEAAAALEGAEAATRTLRGLADVRLEREGQRVRFREAAVLALPDRLRLETLQFGGSTALVLATNGDRLAIYSLATREFAHGRATAAAVAALAGVAVEPRHLLRLLAGLPPLPFRAADPRSRVEADGAGWVAESVTGPFLQRLRLHPTGDVADGELRAAGAPLFTFQFDEFRPLGTRAFPHRLRLEQPGRGRVEVAYRTVELNAPVDDAVFSLAVPPGDVRVLDLDAAGPR